MLIIENLGSRSDSSDYLYNDDIIIINSYHTAFISFGILIISDKYIRARIGRIMINLRNISWCHHQSNKEGTRCLGTWHDLLWL